MKAFLLPLILGGAALLTGCETVAVVDHGPSYYRPGVVYYDSGRPYYYTSGVRYWGYPRGYSGARYTHVEVDRDVTRNYYVDRRTVHHGDQRKHYNNTGTTKVKVQPKPTHQQYPVKHQQYPVKKKKKVVHTDEDRD